MPIGLTAPVGVPMTLPRGVDPSSQAKLKLRFEAGNLIRKPVLKRVKDIAFVNSITVDIDEDRGFFESTYRVLLLGKARDIIRAQNQIAAFFQRLEEENI